MTARALATARAFAAALAVSLAAHIGLALVLASLAPTQPGPALRKHLADRPEPGSFVEVEVVGGGAGVAGAGVAEVGETSVPPSLPSPAQDPEDKLPQPSEPERRPTTIREARVTAAVAHAQRQPAAGDAQLAAQVEPEAAAGVPLAAPGPNGPVAPVTGGTQGALGASAALGPKALPAPASAPRASDLRAYAVQVRQLIDVHKRYPRRAAQRRQEGVVTLELTIDTSGGLIAPPRVLESSGVALLDEEALRMAAAAAPFPPSGAPRPLILHVPVHFSAAALR